LLLSDKQSELELACKIIQRQSEYYKIDNTVDHYNLDKHCNNTLKRIIRELHTNCRRLTLHVRRSGPLPNNIFDNSSRRKRRAKKYIIDITGKINTQLKAIKYLFNGTCKNPFK